MFFEEAILKIYMYMKVYIKMNKKIINLLQKADLNQKNWKL